MATFRVGQRVRIVDCYTFHELYVGKEAVVMGHEQIQTFAGPVDIWIDVAGIGRRAFASFQLAPLTDPGAYAFIERIKRLGKEPVNDAPKEKAAK